MLITAAQTDGIAETLRAIDTTEVAFVVKEVDSKTTKVSMRSKKIDVAKICENFGGGGHTYAAGCTIKANIDETIKKLLREKYFLSQFFVFIIC